MARLFQYQRVAEPVKTTAAATPTGWLAVPEQPVRRLVAIAHLVPQSLIQTTAFPERATPDKWHPEIRIPRFDAKRQQATYEWFSFDPQPFPSPIFADRWHPEISRPTFDLKRWQFSFPSESRGDVPRVERTTPDKWHPPIQQPQFDLKRAQFAAPSFVSNILPIASGETISTDKWHPEISRPTFDLKRWQAIYPAEFRGDVPRVERTTPDKWHPEIQQPRFDVRRQQGTFEWSSFDPIPFPSPIFLDRWWQQPNAPQFRAENRYWFTPPAWTQAVFLERVTADRWHPELQRPRWDVARNQHLYPSLTYSQAFFRESSSLDRWFQPTSEPVRRAPAPDGSAAPFVRVAPAVPAPPIPTTTVQMLRWPAIPTTHLVTPFWWSWTPPVVPATGPARRLAPINAGPSQLAQEHVPQIQVPINAAARQLAQEHTPAILAPLNGSINKLEDLP